MKYNIAVIESGFMGHYLSFLEKICLSHGVNIQIFSDINEAKKSCENFDYVLSDGLPFDFTCNVFHNVSIVKRMQMSVNFLYKAIFYIGHFRRILEAKTLFKKAKKTIVVSENMKTDYSRNCNIPEESIIVAYPGFEKNEENKNLKMKPLKNSEQFVIGINANGFVSKGGYILLEAVRVLRRNHPKMNFKLRIIYTRHKKNLTLNLYLKLFRLNDIIEFCPYQTSMKDYYRSLHCFVSPSLCEAFGRVVPEAMDCKVPVIVGSNVGAACIIEDGKNGFIYEMNKKFARNLAEKIRIVYENYANLEPIIENAYETAQEITWENFAKDLFFGFYPEFQSIKEPSLN